MAERWGHGEKCSSRAFLPLNSLSQPLEPTSVFIVVPRRLILANYDQLPD